MKPIWISLWILGIIDFPGFAFAQRFEQRQVILNRLNGQNGIPVVVEKYNPWAALSPSYYPKAASENLSYNILVPQNGVQYGAFVITNVSSEKQNLLLDVKNARSPIADLEWYQVPFVSSLKNAKVPDPLIPYSSNEISVLPRESKFFIFKVTAVTEGKSQVLAEINVDNEQVNLEINIQTMDIFKSDSDFRLNAVNWGYLNLDMIENIKGEAAQDMKAHHINSVVVPPSHIPKLSSANTKPLIEYLSYFKYVDNILIHCDLSHPYNRTLDKNVSFMSPEWKKVFVQWYYQTIKAVETNGFSGAQVYLYPYDEIKREKIEEFRKFANWAKSAIPSLKIYATFTKREAALDDLMPFIDIAQITTNYQRSVAPVSKNHCDIWMYKVAAGARSLSPYKYYRLMAWTAYVNDITGIGFWNYADIKGKKSNFVTDAVKKADEDYSVIYNSSDGGIISSRRWEAFRLGIEDYEILYLYGEKFGVSKAKKLANKVLGAPNNENIADAIRNQMLKSLAR